MKLRIILSVLSLLALLSTLIGGYLYYSSLKESAFKEADSQAALHAEAIKNHLSSFLAEIFLQRINGCLDYYYSHRRALDFFIDRMTVIHPTFF